MRIGEALDRGRKTLVHSPSAEVDARLLLQFVTNSSHSHLIAHDEDEMNEQQEELYLSLLKRGAEGEPLPYLTGTAPFYGLEFKVSPAVLIPRPETEELVTLALGRLSTGSVSSPVLHVVDVGTGSGCIAVAMAKHSSQVRISAVDVSFPALEIALENAQTHGVLDRINFLRGNLLEPVERSPDLVVANLPYIADHEWSAIGVGVKWYEPDVALRGGRDGLDGIRQLLDQAAKSLAPGGALFLEIGWQQGEAVRALAQGVFPDARLEVRKDLAMLDRIVCVYQDQPARET